MILKFLFVKLKRALSGVALLLACTGMLPHCGPAPAPDTAPGADGNWQRLRGDESGGYYARRRSGLDHLFFYVPATEDGIRELNGAAKQLLAGGYNVLTYRGETRRDARTMAGAFDTAASRLGYRRRLLVVDGERLLPALQELIDRRTIFEAVMVLRPGDAWGDRRDLRALRDELPAHTAYYWIPTGGGAETVRANTLRAMLFRAPAEGDGPKVIEHMLPALAARRDESFRLELSETLLYELVRLRREPEWQNAAAVFQGGCGYRKGARGGRSLNGFTSSGSRDPDFCPAYLRRGDRQVYRNVEILEGGCVYRRMDRQDRLYCYYGN